MPGLRSDNATKKEYFKLPGMRHEIIGRYPNQAALVKRRLDKNMAMKHYRIKKVCSNCGEPYKDSDPLPLCHECIKKLVGYDHMIQNANLDSFYDPHRLSDNEFIGGGS